MRMKKFAKKIFTVLAAVVLLCCTLSVGTLAASDVNTEPYAEITATGIAAAEASEIITVPVNNGRAEDLAAKKSEDAQINFFEKLYEAVRDYISEILCVLAFGGSFLIAVLYKKGLLPLLKSALSAINATVGKIKEATEKGANADAEKTAKITGALDKAYGLIEAQNKTLDAVEKRLDALSADKTERDRLKLILECEVELLYDIFMSSGLPEYQKDAVAKRLKAIESLVKEEKEEA